MSIACAFFDSIFSSLFNIDLHKITTYLPDGDIHVGLLDPQEGLQSGATGRCPISLPLKCHSTLTPGSGQQCAADICVIYTLAKQWRDCSDQKGQSGHNLLYTDTRQCGHKCPVYAYNGYPGRVPFDT
jgi:hypothetical protein